MKDLNEILANVNKLLEQEKTAKPVSSLSELRERKVRRQEIYALRDELNDAVGEISSSLSDLPRLPRTEFVEWANAALNMDLVFLVLDTTGLNDDSDIIRVVIHDRVGVIWDSVIKPERQPERPNTTYTGIKQDDLNAAPTLKAMWPHIQTMLKGRYVLSYNLDFVKGRLTENAEFYKLEPITLIGRCLQKCATDYFDGNCYSMKLIHACSRIGHELPEYPSAPERAAAQLALLKAMSQGITSVQQPVAAPSSDDLLGLDDHPF